MRVRILGPGPGSPGGIGVMSGYLQSTHSDRTTLEFVESGGAPGSKPMRFLRFVTALAKAAFTGDSREVWVLEVSSRGSTWRKSAVAAILRRRSIPYVVHLHSGAYPEFVGRQRPLLQRWVRILFQKATSVAVLGQGWGAYVQEDLGVLPSKTVQLPNAVPGPEQIGRRRAPVRVLFAGRVGTRKGAHTLLKAWANLNTDGHATLVLAGDMDDPDRQIARALATASNVEVTEWLSSAALIEQMDRAQVLVLPSQAENLPLSLLEGMAWELAPIVTPVGAVPEVIQDGHNGLLVPVSDVGALAAALERAIFDDDERARLAASARQTWAQHYSLDTYRPRFDDMVEQVHRMHSKQGRPTRGRRSKGSRKAGSQWRNAGRKL